MHSYYDDNSNDLLCPLPYGEIEIILAENQQGQEQLKEMAELHASYNVKAI